jgi:lambda repressor-like predicted transcriptional regulator
MEKPKRRGMSPREIYGRLLMKGLTAQALGRELGISGRAVSLVITRKGRSRRVQEAIARALGLGFERVWGNSRAARRGRPPKEPKERK